MSGLHPAEVAGDLTFAWSHPLATVSLRGLDRSVGWRCTVLARGARPGAEPQPQVSVGVDGVTVLSRTVTNEFEPLDISVPERANRGLALSISADPAFVPGPGDARSLGIQIDRIECAPERALALPGPAALWTAVASGAIFGLLFALLCRSYGLVAGALILVGSACALMLNMGVAAYERQYLERVVVLAVWNGVVAAALVLAYERAGRALSGTARLVVGFTAAVLFLKIAALLHPSKDVVDALFHARRLGWVLDGRYYFTQPMPGGVHFPYAIGLYVAASPFAALARDHMALLRIVVLVAEAAAAGLLYLVVSRSWSDRRPAAAAAILYHLAPLPFIVVGNANLTFAFAQAVAVTAVAIALLLPSTTRRRLGMAALLLATLLAYLSHIAVFPLLAVTLVVLGGLYWLGRDLALHRSGVPIVTIAVLAAIVSVAVYYAHFPDVYRNLDRVSSPEPGAGVAAAVVGPLPLSERAARAGRLGLRAYGPAMVLLAAVGAWFLARLRRDALTLGLAAWAVCLVVFLLFRILAPVDARLQRYADEFIERVYYLTLPAVAILAGFGAVRWWDAGIMARTAVALACSLVVWRGAASWLAWIS